MVLFCWLGTTAQTTIDQGDMPHAGDDLYRTRAFTNPFVDYTTTGPNTAWDFSGLQANTQDSANYVTVGSTNFVYAIAYADIFFNPNRANHAISGVDIPFYGLLPITDPYTFHYRNASVYKTVGFGAEISGLPVPIIFNDHDEVYQLPIDYGDADTSSSDWELSLPTLFHYGYLQQRRNEVDGWGTIQTPAGIFDVLRVKTELEGRDTIALDTLSIGFAIDRPLVTEYKWLASGYRVPILQINTTEIFGFEVVTDIWFYDEPRSIVVVPPIGSLCPGATVDISYDATGAFNTGGFLIPANDFTAQLSDATGDFSSPVNIGSITSPIDGTITCTIPPGTPAGTGYRIRVVSDSPTVIGADNGYDLTVGGSPVPAIGAGGATGFCDGDSVVLTASGGPDYQWQLNGSDIPGATAADLVVSASGSYTVVVVNGCGTGTSAAIDVVVNALPEHELAAYAFEACAGSSVTIEATDLSGQSPLTYQWLLDGIPVPGADSLSITVATAGEYALAILNDNTGCGFTTAAATFTVNTPTPPMVYLGGSTTFCDGGSVALSTDSLAGLQWTLDAIAIPGANGVDLLVSASGSYAVLGTDSNGCEATSLPVDVVVNAPPTTPVIGASADTLYTSGGISYQWYLDSVAIPGATDSSLIALVSGDYSVMITDSNGCSSVSAEYTYISTGLSAGSGPAFAAYPNPTDGMLTIIAPAASYAVHDASGRVLMHGRMSAGVNTVDLTGQPPGMYSLRLMSDNGVHGLRIVLR